MDTYKKSERDAMLKQVMAADFTAYDLALYLNTHPNDMRAILLYRDAVQRAEILSDNFQQIYGPLTARRSVNPYVWQWIEGPWPWEEGV